MFDDSQVAATQVESQELVISSPADDVVAKTFAAMGQEIPAQAAWTGEEQHLEEVRDLLVPPVRTSIVSSLNSVAPWNNLDGWQPAQSPQEICGSISC